jgi:hypothetical protein
MWVNCHNCNGYGYINCNNDKKNDIPCVVCNYNNQTYVYLIGQIWVDDDYEPIEEPDNPDN